MHLLAIFVSYILLVLTRAADFNTNFTLRAVVVSADNRRYDTTREKLNLYFGNKIQIVRHHPVPFDSKELDVYYNRLNGLVHVDNFANNKRHKLRKVFSNLWSFYTVMSEFAAESHNVSTENDWLMIFEDDVSLNSAVKNALEDVKEALHYSTSDGILFLGKCVAEDQKFHCQDIKKTAHGIELGRCIAGACAHAFAVTKWKARFLPGVVFDILKAHKSVYFDAAMLEFSRSVHPVPLIGSNLQGPNAKNPGHIGNI